MTELLSGFGQSLLGQQILHQMPDQRDEEWREQYFNQIVPGAWTGAQAATSTGFQNVDLRVFQRNDRIFATPYTGSQDQMLSPSMGYTHDAWASDMDMGTPSTGGFQSEFGETFTNPTQTPSVHLHPPEQHRGSGSGNTSQNEGFGLHPSTQSASDATVARPSFNRSTTAPEQRERKSNAPGVSASTSKRGSASDEDDEFAPAVEDAKARGRKRQRIPHTAVERRYRENLNAHLDKLRQAVPALTTRRPGGVDKGGGGGGGGGGVEGVKPSKCEILNGAIEHIAALDREVSALRDENQALRTRVAEMQGWYGANQG